MRARTRLISLLNREPPRTSSSCPAPRNVSALICPEKLPSLSPRRRILKPKTPTRAGGDGASGQNRGPTGRDNPPLNKSPKVEFYKIERNQTKMRNRTGRGSPHSQDPSTPSGGAPVVPVLCRRVLSVCPCTTKSFPHVSSSRSVLPPCRSVLGVCRPLILSCPR